MSHLGPCDGLSSTEVVAVVVVGVCGGRAACPAGGGTGPVTSGSASALNALAVRDLGIPRRVRAKHGTTTIAEPPRRVPAHPEFAGFSTPLSGALSRSGPNALPYALDVLVPELAKVADNDPGAGVKDFATLTRAFWPICPPVPSRGVRGRTTRPGGSVVPGQPEMPIPGIL